ncbi:MAG: TerC family protein [Deltaproteobacteria bacterium]|nr:MAG: TerC family protein [Deltaproteobacteria bacterium]
MTWMAQPEAWIALATLTALEIVLGIDNIIFISILVGRLPAVQRKRARIMGLALAMGMRLLLLFAIRWVMGLTEPLFTLFGKPFSGRTLILIGGGLFLLGKSTHEIHVSLEGAQKTEQGKEVPGLAGILLQIALLDVVFSLDSVITAVGLVEHIAIMVIAIVISIGIMMYASQPIGEFVDRHPTIKMLALSFLILVGVTLLGEGFGFHIPRGYIYFSMAFSFAVELLNLRVRAQGNSQVKLTKRIVEEG